MAQLRVIDPNRKHARELAKEALATARELAKRETDAAYGGGQHLIVTDDQRQQRGGVQYRHRKGDPVLDTDRILRQSEPDHVVAQYPGDSLGAFILWAFIVIACMGGIVGLLMGVMN